VIWPGLSSIYTKSGDVPSFFLAPRLDYTGSETPDAGKLVFYQKMFREAGGENGLTLTRISDVPAVDKLQADRDFYDTNLSGYEFTALYAGTDEAYEAVAQEETLAGIRTVCMGPDAADAPVSIVGGNLTKQRATVNGFSHTYSDDLRVKSLETCLGYSNILVDLKTILVPEGDEDKWETRSERLASYTTTCWKPFAAFAKTSVTESDERIRQFFSLSYQESRQDDVITLQIEGPGEQHSFLLRTHNEKIKEVEGASWTKIEDHAYLIEADEATVLISVEKDHTLYYENP
jgi:hypothetical protein